MARVRVRYWAGARQAAGCESEDVEADTLAALLDVIKANRDQRFAHVLAISSFLIDEQQMSQQAPADVVLHDGAVVDVLPPFAGG